MLIWSYVISQQIYFTDSFRDRGILYRILPRDFGRTSSSSFLQRNNNYNSRVFEQKCLSNSRSLVDILYNLAGNSWGRWTRMTNISFRSDTKRWCPINYVYLIVKMAEFVSSNVEQSNSRQSKLNYRHCVHRARSSRWFYIIILYSSLICNHRIKKQGDKTIYENIKVSTSRNCIIVVQNIYVLLSSPFRLFF